jgi:hypothetical protein
MDVSHIFMTRLFLLTLILVFTFTVNLHAQHLRKSAIINGNRYIGHLEFWGFFLLTQKGDTVLSLPQEEFFDFKFQDFNRDGYKDLYLDWGGNAIEKYSLYLFVPSTKTFKELKDFSDFPAAERIKGTNYYYSYAKAGCADNTWVSDLFYVNNMTVIKIGTINGEGCGIKDGIYIYKVKAGKETLIKTLPLNIIDRYKDYKWGFIKAYWTKNYKGFL